MYVLFNYLIYNTIWYIAPRPLHIRSQFAPIIPTPLQHSN